jgi:hypothetical protein
VNEKEKLKLLRDYLKKTVGFTLENSTKLKKKTYLTLFSINNLNLKEKTKKKKKQIVAQTKQERNNSNVSNQVF